MKKYNDDIVADIRLNLGIKADDESLDGLIYTMPKNEVFDRVVAWNNLPGFGNVIRSWVKDIYGVTLRND